MTRTDPDQALRDATQFWQRGRTADVIATLWPVSRDHPERLDVRLLLGRAYLKAGRPKLALRQAEAIEAMHPKLATGLWLKALSLSRLARDAEAERALVAVLATDPRHEEALFELVRFQGLRKDHAAQDKTVERLIALKPDHMGYRLEYAKSKMRRKDLAGAEAILKAAIKVNPYHAETHNALAHLYYETGRLEAAMDEANVALRVEPNYAKPLALFRAAYYVAVASELSCHHGPSPWKKEVVDVVLRRYSSQGVKGTAFFYEVHDAFGSQSSVQQRVAQAAKRCREKRVSDKPPAK